MSLTFQVTRQLHNRKAGSAPREHGPTLRLTGTTARFNIYKDACAILGVGAKDFVGIVCGRTREDGPERAYVFVGEAGLKDENGKTVNPTIGSQLSPIKNSEGTFTFSMSAAYADIKELYSEFKGGKKGAIKMQIDAENFQVMDSYENMRGPIKFFELTPVQVVEEDDEEEDEVEEVVEETADNNNANSAN